MFNQLGLDQKSSWVLSCKITLCAEVVRFPQGVIFFCGFLSKSIIKGEKKMHRLLYYPDFEIQDETLLKFALLYIDEIRPIVPEGAMPALSDAMKDILRYTDLMNCYEPGRETGRIASGAAIRYLEKEYLGRPSRRQADKYMEKGEYNYTLYEGKYTLQFEEYCLENGLAERCDEGIFLNSHIAYIYMSVLAEVISYEENMDTITDFSRYADPLFKEPLFTHKREERKRERKLESIKREIQFQLPVDIRKIPLHTFISLRSNEKFNELRKYFNKELNEILDKQDMNLSEVNLYNYLDCKREMYALMKETYGACVSVLMGVISFRNILGNADNAIDFFGNLGNISVRMSDVKKHMDASQVFERNMEGKKKARKYLAKLNRVGLELL